MAATYHHARRLYIGTTAERAAVVLDVDGIGTDYWDTDVGVLYIWDGTAWVAGFAALPHSILSVTHDDTTPAAVVRGDLMTGQGVAPLWQRLAHPGALYHLQTDANDVIWSQDIIMADDSHIGGTGLLDGRIIFDYTPAPDEIHIADATLVMDTSHILPAGAGQDLGSGIARWDVFAAFVDLPGTGWVGVGPASERLIFNVAGDATFAGVTSVVVPDGCWVGADANCSWVYDLGNSVVTTLDKVGVGTPTPAYDVEIERATPRMAFDTTGTASYSAFRFLEAGATVGSVQRIGSTFAVVARREFIEIFNNSVVGGISLHVNNVAAPAMVLNVAGVVTIPNLGGGGNQDVGADNNGLLYVPFVSDAKFKTNVEQIIGGLAAVRLLRGVTFNWNQDALDDVGLDFGDCGLQAGMIAGEVGEVIPLAYRDGPRYESFDERAITPYLVEAIKELDARLEKLEAR